MLFRIYEPHELGADGYPHVWHSRAAVVDPDPELARLDSEQRAIAAGLGIERPADAGVKDLVRAQAGNRCERCKHPYVLGGGVWGEATDPQFQAALALYEDDPEGKFTPTALTEKRAPLWSPCDERCDHGGPIRERQDGEKWWEHHERVDDGIVASMVRSGHAQVQAAWRILTVHHLNGRKHDLRWWNLAALCQRCHLEIQNKVVMERVYPFEHTEWFRPHAAGWYAYAYMGEDLTREQVMENLDNLLALERMA